MNMYSILKQHGNHTIDRGDRYYSTLALEYFTKNDIRARKCINMCVQVNWLDTLGHQEKNNHHWNKDDFLY